MPEPRDLTDQAMEARAKELHLATVRADAERSATPRGESGISRSMGNWTIAITEVVRAGETLHVITASDPRAYNMLRANPQWLRPYERVLGEHLNYYTAVEGRRPNTNRIHAEQLSPWIVTLEVKGTIVRVVASRYICEACIRFYEEFLPQVRLVNPDPNVQLRPRPAQPPPVPASGPLPRSMLGPSQPGGSAFTIGQRATAGAVLAVQAANYLIGEYVTRREEARYREAYRAKEGFLNDFQSKNPTVGVLVIAYFDAAIFRPPLEFAYGMTEIQARSATPPRLRSGTATSYATWRPPLRPADVTSVRPPFPPVMLATFVGREVFQGLEFRGFDGFDDDGETDLGHPRRGDQARFWILRPPSRVDWYNGSDRGSKDLDIIRRRLASGESVECVDLDPTIFSYGNDSAFPAYPADVATDVTFMRAPGISDRVHALRAYDLDHVRWIAPERARSIGG